MRKEVESTVRWTVDDDQILQMGANSKYYCLLVKEKGDEAVKDRISYLDHN